MSDSHSAGIGKKAGLVALGAIITGLVLMLSGNLSFLKASILDADNQITGNLGRLTVELIDNENGDGTGDGFYEALSVTCDYELGCQDVGYKIYLEDTIVAYTFLDNCGGTTCSTGVLPLEYGTDIGVHAIAYWAFGDPTCETECIFEFEEVYLPDFAAEGILLDACPTENGTLDGCADETGPSIDFEIEDNDGDGFDEYFTVACADPETGCASVTYDLYKLGKRGDWVYLVSGTGRCNPPGNCDIGRVSVSNLKSYRLEASAINGYGLTSTATYEGAGDACPSEPGDKNGCATGGGGAGGGGGKKK